MKHQEKMQLVAMAAGILDNLAKLADQGQVINYNGINYHVRNEKMAKDYNKKGKTMTNRWAEAFDLDEMENLADLLTSYAKHASEFGESLAWLIEKNIHKMRLLNSLADGDDLQLPETLLLEK